MAVTESSWGSAGTGRRRRREPLYGGDVGCRVDADGPIGEPLVEEVGLVDGAGGEPPQDRVPGSLVLVPDDGEHLGALAQVGGVATGGPRTPGECGDQPGVGDAAVLADPPVAVAASPGRALGAAGRHEDRRGCVGGRS